ncbi:MAG: hypothetical protein KGS60_02065 [Verrucomicrobia bacterium]|nr:hypothetical protein [Verrucomicrobiota bacterium]
MKPGLMWLACLLAGVLLTDTRAGWQVGVAKADITPTEPVPLAGYSGAARMHVRTDHPIWLKALAIRPDDGPLAVLVTADLVGLSTRMVERIVRDAAARGVSRAGLVLNSSHNHSCPVTEDVLWLYYEFTAEQTAACERYTERVYSQYDAVIAGAIADLGPAELSFGQGLAGVAVNRRRARGPGTRQFGGQVDQDVPVIVARSGDKLRAVVFGYSCHTTALGGLSVNGDYAGFAQLELEERYPEAVALFVQNCGGDANPLPRIRGNDPGADAAALALAANYGRILAEAVSQTLTAPLRPLPATLSLAMGGTKLALEPGLPLEELRERVPQMSGLPKRAFNHFIRQYETEGGLPGEVEYPIQVWRFGPELTFIALTGETVVDYSLQLKARYGWESTWVCGYNNDLLSYIPSRRVLREGGYEGITGMYEYGHRAPYTDDVEQRILTEVDRLIRGPAPPSGGGAGGQ